MRQMADSSRLTWALILSVLVHGLLLSILPFIRRAHLEIPNPAQLLDVDVISLPKPAPPAPAAPPPPPAVAAAAPAPPALPVPKQQIVSPPEQGEEKEPENPRFLSDRNNTVKEEMVHHGEPAAGDPDQTHKAAPQPVAKTKPEPVQAERPPKAGVEHPQTHTQVAALPKLDQLLPTAGDLLRQGIVKPQQAAPAAGAAQASTQRTDLLSHGDPWRTGGIRGSTLDYLPTVREGDITLLNTKAEQFAPFVRRVAVRVFENFRMLLRRSVDGGHPQASQEFATIEAIMDKRGRLLEIKTTDRSGSSALATDRNLQDACREGFFDRNPPPGAESNDGNIHFLFDAHVALMVDPGGRGVVGYRALFQAGLM